MAKKELIEKWESKEGVPSYEISAFPVNPSLNEMYIAGYGVARKEILEDLKQLDEPKKVIFSHEEKFVVDWLNNLRGQISDVKLNYGAVFMTFIGRQLERYYDEDYSLITEKIESWLTVPKNKVKLMSAIDNGYEVEKEPLYAVKGLTDYFRYDNKVILFNDKQEASDIANKIGECCEIEEFDYANNSNFILSREF